MDGFGKSLYWFSEENLTLEVPFFQRPYVWDDENWASLINSINESKDGTMPFIGSFILQTKDSKNYWVIDGQQRITTLTIMIKALLDFYTNLLPRVRVIFEGVVFKTEVVNLNNIINTPRLTPAYMDHDDYEYVMGDSIEKEKLENMDSKIAECYKFFYNFFEDLDEESLKIFTTKLLTTNKYVIAITLDQDDDEQAIFDTVNSLGKRLTNSDIIKNYLYQQMKNYVKDNPLLVDQVLEHYKKYWDKIFCDGERRDFWDTRVSLGRITTTNLDSFLKDYGTIKGIYIPSESGGYDGLAKQYKNYINKLSYDELQEFSKELSSYADTFYKMKFEYNNCNDFRIKDYLNTTLLILDKLELSTFNPYILQLVKNNDPDKENKLFNLQKFILKRFCWKASIKNYNKVCTTLLESTNPIGYLNSYNEQTIDVEWDYYPQGLKTIKNAPATLILFLIEMIRRNKKGEDNYSDPLLYNKTLEHIMPQKWEKNWSNVPSYILNQDNEYEEVTDYDEKIKNRKSKIYSIGNMTLLSSKLNTSISNDAFEYKINGKAQKGIKYFVGSLSIAQEIVDIYHECKKWDEINIMDRELSLFDELNDYYGFVQEIKTNQSDDVKTDDNLDISYFDNNFFSNKKIGEMVKTSFKFMVKNVLLTHDDLLNLQDVGFSIKKLSCAFPVLATDSSKLKDTNGIKRYYKEPIYIDNNEYYLCKEWYEHDRKYIVPFIKDKLNQNTTNA